MRGNEKDIARGNLLCDWLAWYGFEAEWLFDPSGELLLLIDGNHLYRCIGEHEVNGEILPYWCEVRPTHNSIARRQYHSQGIDYTPLYEV